MDNNENIKLDNGWATTEVSPNGVITVTIKNCEKPTVYNFEAEVGGSVRSSRNKIVIKDGQGRSHTFTEDSPQQSLEDQAKEAIRAGYDNTLRDLIEEKGLSANAIIPETGRTLLQELCVTWHDEGFADCLSVLLNNGADKYSRVAGTNGTILHLLAERGSLRKWDIITTRLHKDITNKLLGATDNEGNTPLHIAARAGWMGIYALIYGLSGPECYPHKVKNKQGKTPRDIINESCSELNVAVCARTPSEEDERRLKKDPQYRTMVYDAERYRIMLWHMTRYFYNAIHHRHLYGEEEER